MKKCIPLILFSLVLLSLLALPFTAVSSFSLQIVAFILINMVVVSGLVILYGFSDQISLAQGAFFGIGAYIYAILSTTLNLPALLALSLACIVSAALGFLLGLPVLKLKGHYLAMGTLAFSELVVWGLTEAKAFTGGVDGFSSIKALHHEVRFAFVLLVIIAALALLSTRNLASSKTGDFMRALGMSEVGARSLKVDIEGIKLRSHSFAAGAAGLGGALYASFVGFISPEQFGSAASILFLAMAIIGGRYRLIGPLLSVVALTLIQYLAVILNITDPVLKNLFSTVQVDIYALIIIGVTIFAALRKRS